MKRNYEQAMQALARSDRGEDRQLAADLVRYLSERSRDSRTIIRQSATALPKVPCLQNPPETPLANPVVSMNSTFPA